MKKKDLESAKNWIISNQSSDGAIYWDEKGKCDAWDHCECLIALAIFEEWEAFDKGIDWVLNNVNSEGLIYSEFSFNKPSKDFFEAHHAAYIFLPLLQRYLIDGKKEYLKKISNQYSIPFELLAKILQKLSKVKILKAIHGPKGGYKLNDKYKNFTLVQLIEVLEGPFGITGCLTDHNCEQISNCNIITPIEKINSQVYQVLNQIKLNKIT